jgi:hypothetical protein
MGMTTPTLDQTDRDHPAPRAVSDLALQLWVLALIIAQFMLTYWWFSRMYST